MNETQQKLFDSMVEAGRYRDAVVLLTTAMLGPELAAKVIGQAMIDRARK